MAWERRRGGRDLPGERSSAGGRAKVVAIIAGLAAAGAVVVMLILREKEGSDVFDLMAQASSKGDGADYFLYEHEGKRYSGRGTVTSYEKAGKTLVEVNIKSQSGRVVACYYTPPEDAHKRPPELSPGDRISFRCRIGEVGNEFGKRPAPILVSFEKE
jgi:hypothetical protein